MSWRWIRTPGEGLSPSDFLGSLFGLQLRTITPLLRIVSSITRTLGLVVEIGVFKMTIIVMLGTSHRDIMEGGLNLVKRVQHQVLVIPTTTM